MSRLGERSLPPFLAGPSPMISPHKSQLDRPLVARQESSWRRCILILDDQPVAAIGLAFLIERDSEFDCRCVTGRCDQALELIEELRPALIIIDTACERCRGLTLLRKVSEAHPNINTLVYTAQNEKTFARRILLAGSTGFVSKRAGPSTVIAAIRQVLAGQMCYSNAVAQGFSQSTFDQVTTEEPAKCLSDRELEVFTRIGHGETNRAMAREMVVKPKTIESYREKIKAKLSLQDSNQLVQRAVRWIVEQGE